MLTNLIRVTTPRYKYRDTTDHALRKPFSCTTLFELLDGRGEDVLHLDITYETFLFTANVIIIPHAQALICARPGSYCIREILTLLLQ